MELKTTQRGFTYYQFKDRNGELCSIQESSLATEAAIWLGIDDANPIIMHSDAKKLGMEVNTDSGWVSYPIPDQVLLHTRMHLTIDQVKALLPILENFVKTGCVE
jgi:hypothetical protein